MTRSDAVPEAITTYFRAINSEDWDLLSTVWRDDAELVAAGARPRRGREAVVAYYPKALGPYQEHLDQPTRFIVAGDTVTVEIRFTGQAVDGTACAFDAVDVFDLVDGRIARVTNWYDVAAVRAMLPRRLPVVDEYFRCINEEDWDAFTALWTDDAEVLAAGARPRRGVDDLMTLYRKLFDHWPAHRDEPGRIFVDGSTVIVEVHFVGTTDRGHTLEFDAVDVIDIERSRIRRLTNWYDSAKVRAMTASGS